MTEPDDDDKLGVFVPFWMLSECASMPANAAVYLAQMAWLWQPGLRGQDRATIIERKGHRWLAARDAEFADLLGISADTVGRIRIRLRQAGLIETLTVQIEGIKTALVRPAYPQPAVESTAGSGQVNRSERVSQPQSAVLRLSSREEKEKGEPADDPVRRAADRVVSDWWERRRDQGQTPVQPYIAVVKIVDRALRQGVSVNDMKFALDTTPTVTAAALEFALSKARGRVGRPAPVLSEAAEAQIVSDYLRGDRPPHPPGRALPCPP